MKQEERGTVITLTGQVLFSTGDSKLLGPARARLSMVADSLMTTYPDKPITVEGHSDSQGSDALNQRLSQKRAEAVGDFLVQQGVASDRIQAVGKGESQPIASNDTPEGRANNRRVEIVIGGTGQSASGSQSELGDSQAGSPQDDEGNSAADRQGNQQGGAASPSGPAGTDDG